MGDEGGWVGVEVVVAGGMVGGVGGVWGWGWVELASYVLES